MTTPVSLRDLAHPSVRRQRLLAILRIAQALPGNRPRFEAAGLHLEPARPDEDPEATWEAVRPAFLRLAPIDRQTVRAAPGDHLADAKALYYRGSSSGTQGAAHIFFADAGWNAVRLACRTRSLETWGLGSTPILNLASRLRPAGAQDVAVVGPLGPSLLAEMARWLDRGPVALRGYPSRLGEVAEAWCRSPWVTQKRHANVRAILCTGESLYAVQRDRMAEIWDAPVVNEYGCHETGLSGISCPEVGALHLDTERAWIEVLDGHLVATDLYNTVAPVVRYRCGDAATLAKRPCPCGRPQPVVHLAGRFDASVRTRWGPTAAGDVPMPSLPGVGIYQAALLEPGRVAVWAYSSTHDTPQDPAAAVGLETAVGLEAWAHSVLGADDVALEWLDPPSAPARETVDPATWRRRVTEASWNPEQGSNGLPEGALEPVAKLLNQVCNPGLALATRGTEALEPWLDEVLTLGPLENPEDELLACRVLALAATQLPWVEDPSRGSGTQGRAIEMRLRQALRRQDRVRDAGAADPQPANSETVALWRAAETDAALLADLTLPSLGLRPSGRPPVRAHRRLDALGVQHALLALETAWEASRRQRRGHGRDHGRDPRGLSRRLRPMLAILISDFQGFAPDFGDWLLGLWGMILGLEVPEAVRSAPAPGAYADSWRSTRRAWLADDGPPATWEQALCALRGAAGNAEQEARAELEAAYGWVLWGGDVTPQEWIDRVDRYAPALSIGYGETTVDPVPWAPLLRALAGPLAAQGDTGLAHACLVTSTTPTSRISAFDRVSRSCNSKLSTVVDLTADDQVVAGQGLADQGLA